MSDAIYGWFVAAPWRYYLVAIPFAALFLAGVLLPRRVPAWLFLLSIGGCLFAFRWPVMVFGFQFGADESQVIAGAMTLAHRPVFWRDVDAHAIGPATIYPLTLLHSLGVPFTYFAARAFGLFITALGVAAAYRVLREYWGEAWGRAGIVPPTAFYALTRFNDFSAYSAEIVAGPLLAIGAAGVFVGARRALAAETGARTWAAVGAAALVASLWAKLQAAPIAAVILAGSVVAMVTSLRPDPRQRQRMLTAVAGGAAVAALLPVGVLAATGAWRDFIDSYLRAGLNYLGQPELSRPAVLGRFLTAAETGFPTFAWPLLAVLAGLAYTVIRRCPSIRTLVVTLLAAVAAGAFTVSAPGRFYPHYLGVIILPLALAAAAGPAALFPESAGPRHRAAVGAFVVATALPQVALLFTAHVKPQLIKWEEIRMTMTDTANIIVASAPAPGATLTVWGWEPGLHVMTGLPQGTREAHAEREIKESPLQAFYRARFLQDFRRSPPDYFVEAIGPNSFFFHDVEKEGFARWPDLSQIIAVDYRLIATTAGGRRIYSRIPR